MGAAPFLLIFLLYAWLFRGMTRQMGGGSGGSGGGGMNPFNVGKATGKLADKDKVNKGALLVGLREPVRPCSPRPWPGRPTCPSSASAAPTSWRCSWESAPPACATSSPRRRRRPLHSVHR